MGERTMCPLADCDVRNRTTMVMAKRMFCWQAPASEPMKRVMPVGVRAEADR